MLQWLPSTEANMNLIFLVGSCNLESFLMWCLDSLFNSIGPFPLDNFLMMSLCLTLFQFTVNSSQHMRKKRQFLSNSKPSIIQYIYNIYLDRMHDFVMDQCFHDEPLNMLREGAT
jgi:hypothetical protein